MNSRPPGLSRAATVAAARDARQPTESADAGEDKVKLLPAQSWRRVVDIGLDEVHVVPCPGDQGTCLLERGRREVQPGHPSAEPGQAERVGTDVALQVDPPQSAHSPSRARSNCTT